MLACLFLLGLQFCFPLALQAGALNAVDEISLRSSDPEAPNEYQGLHQDLCLLGSDDLSLRTPFWCDAPLGRQIMTDDRSVLELLLVSGLQPSAP